LKAVISLASDINQPAIASLIVPVLKNFRILNEDSKFFFEREMTEGSGMVRAVARNGVHGQVQAALGLVGVHASGGRDAGKIFLGVGGADVERLWRGGLVISGQRGCAKL
jgi:hypothetical protein